MKQRKARKVGILLLEVVILILLIWYSAIRYKYDNIFCNNTIINGVDCSLMTVEEAKEEIQQKEENYVLKVIFKDDKIENISGTEIDFATKNLDQELNKIKERQIKSLILIGKKYEIDNFSYDVDKLEKVLSSKKQLKQRYMKKKTKIKYTFNSNSNLFELKEKKIYYLDFNEVLKKVSKAIEKGKDKISMEKLYAIPEDSNLDELNSLISARIEYKLPKQGSYVLDASTLYTWIAQDEEGNYFKDEDVWNQNIENFVKDKLSVLVDTTRETRSFKPTGKDDTISVKGGNYGYLVDVEAEIQKLKKELENQEIASREPCYQKTEVKSSKNYTLGNSYVEIDLTRQKVWVYVDGKLKVETDCVTGCVNKGNGTPTGIFTLTYKQKDRILRGEKLPNGRYSYQSHVDYWMPFNGGIGLHDASWRNSFGGDIYITNGSHGCVNLPLDAAEKIYDIINGEMPIVVYESE